MTEENNTNLKQILGDPKFKDLPDDAEIPDELIEQLSGDDLTKIFVEKMIQDKGDEPTDKLRAKLVDDVNAKISEEIISNLPDYMVDQINQKIESNNMTDEDLDKMIEEAGVDVETITENAMISFRDAYLGASKDDKDDDETNEEEEE